jgi:TonB-dependent SusC/RagA subfamily outer membrane receptor
MKNSITLSTLLPAVLATLAGAGCSRSKPASAPSPRALRPASGITAEDIDRSPTTSLEELLLTRVPGLMLTRGPDGRTIMHIRGITTLSAGDEPLFVVNGVPLVSSMSLGALNRFDIASVEVIKDPATTSMWGIRGSNGVIVIRTKGS